MNSVFWREEIPGRARGGGREEAKTEQKMEMEGRTLPSTLLSLQVSSALSSLSIFTGRGRMLSFSSRPGRDLFWRKEDEAHEISDCCVPETDGHLTYRGSVGRSPRVDVGHLR